MTASEALPIIEEELESFKQRLIFLDMYDSITLKLAERLAETMNRQQERIAMTCEMMSSGDAWATAQMAAVRIREGGF